MTEPLDPDWSHVPEAIREAADRNGRTAYVLTDEGVESGTLFISPGPWGDRRRREGDD
jgi:hypothetical protein